MSWGKAKEAIGKTVGDTSPPVAKEACSALALSLVKGKLGAGRSLPAGPRKGAFHVLSPKSHAC